MNLEEVKANLVIIAKGYAFVGVKYNKMSASIVELSNKINKRKDLNESIDEENL